MKPLANVREVLKTIKRRKPTQIFCPRCASPRIGLSSSFDMWLTPQNFACQSCGYLGPIVMELEKVDEKEGNGNEP